MFMVRDTLSTAKKLAINTSIRINFELVQKKI